MSFPENAIQVAQAAMEEIDPNLVDRYKTVIDFLQADPEFAPRATKKAPLGSERYIERLAAKFSDGRIPKSLKPPQTVQDSIIPVILGLHGNHSQEELSKMQNAHSLSMGAENLVGDLLEQYIASKAEQSGWVWCSGSTAKKADFIKPPEPGSNTWQVLQIKNRDNSENSSSRSVRDGTNIQKWHRTFARKPGSNWKQFPDKALVSQLSEDDFQSFVTRHMTAIKSAE